MERGPSRGSTPNSTLLTRRPYHRSRRRLTCSPLNRPPLRRSPLNPFNLVKKKATGPYGKISRWSTPASTLPHQMEETYTLSQVSNLGPVATPPRPGRHMCRPWTHLTIRTSTLSFLHALLTGMLLPHLPHPQRTTCHLRNPHPIVGKRKTSQRRALIAPQLHPK